MAMEKRERIVTNSRLKLGVLRLALKHLQEDRWPPEQISGYLRLKGIHISKERIYREIRADQSGELKEFCYHKRNIGVIRRSPARQTANQ